MDKVWIIVEYDSMSFECNITAIDGIYTSKEKAEEAKAVIERIEMDIFECGGGEDIEIIEMPIDSVSPNYRNALIDNIKTYQRHINAMTNLLNEENQEDYGVKGQNWS